MLDLVSLVISQCLFVFLQDALLLVYAQQKDSMATTADRMKEVEADSASADSIFQQLDSLRIMYEEYSKMGKDIPQAQTELDKLNKELDQKTQALDDVIFLACTVYLLAITLVLCVSSSLTTMLVY